MGVTRNVVLSLGSKGYSGNIEKKNKAKNKEYNFCVSLVSLKLHSALFIREKKYIRFTRLPIPLAKVKYLAFQKQDQQIDKDRSYQYSRPLSGPYYRTDTCSRVYKVSPY